MQKSVSFIMRELFFYISEKVAGDSFHTFHEVSKLSPMYNSPNFFFIQIGANDGKTGDPIHKMVMDYQWTGILVEPIKGYFEMLQKTYEGNKNLSFENVAIGEKNQQKKIYRIKESGKHLPKGLQGIASFNKNVLLKHNFVLPDFETYVTEETVTCITLKDLLMKYGVEKIDLLCIDTEGYEYKIIQQLDTVSVKPSIIFYEHKHLNEEDKRNCETYLHGLGYEISKKFDNTIAHQKQ